MGTEHYWIDPDHREALDLGKSQPGWGAHEDLRVPAKEMGNREMFEQMTGICGDAERMWHAGRVLRVTREAIETAQLDDAEMKAKRGECEEADGILDASVWPWRGALGWFEARNRERVFRTTHGESDDPILFKVELSERETGARDFPEGVDGVGLTAVHPEWTLYTVYRGTGNGSRGTDEEFDRHGYQVYRYGGDPLYRCPDKLECPGKNVPETFDDILTKEETP